MGQYSIPCLTSKVEPETAKAMIPGTFWNLENVRLKNGGHQTLEFDFYGTKFYQIWEASDDIHLNELLKSVIHAN